MVHFQAHRWAFSAKFDHLKIIGMVPDPARLVVIERSESATRLVVARSPPMPESPWFSAEIVPLLRSDKLYRLGLRFTKYDETSAEDLVQDVSVKAWRSRETFAPGSNAWAWLATIARNHAINTSKSAEIRTRSRALCTATPPEQSQSLEQELDGSRARTELLSRIDALGLPWSEVLRRRVINGESCNAIAADLGVLPATIASRTYRAIKELTEGPTRRVGIDQVAEQDPALPEIPAAEQLELMSHEPVPDPAVCTGVDVLDRGCDLGEPTERGARRPDRQRRHAAVCQAIDVLDLVGFVNGRDSVPRRRRSHLVSDRAGPVVELQRSFDF
jgi:RNA polymerase sigma-70 factor (ECF subfamily)